jgi:hypothetical protein
MAKVYDLDAYRNAERPQDEPPRSRNQEILAELQAKQQALDTPKARLLNELRGMEETLLAGHRRYARLWEAADQLGINPPVRTPSQILAEAEGMFPEHTPSLPPSLSVSLDAPAEKLPSPGDIAYGDELHPEPKAPDRQKDKQSQQAAPDPAHRAQFQKKDRDRGIDR